MNPLHRLDLQLRKVNIIHKIMSGNKCFSNSMTKIIGERINYRSNQVREIQYSIPLHHSTSRIDHEVFNCYNFCLLVTYQISVPILAGNRYGYAM